MGLGLGVGLFARVQRTSAQSFITIANYGGSTGAGEQGSWGKKFTEMTGIEVKQAAPMDYGKFKAMVLAKNITWDWLDAEGFFPFGNEELLDPLDYGVVGVKREDLFDLEDAMLPQALCSYLTSYALAYRTDHAGPVPSSWAEFFDTKAFPGKRSLYNFPYGMLEAALLGDGVDAKSLYPLDLDRAFKKIDSIKSDLVFWNTGAESQQYLVNGTVDFIVGWTTRLAHLAQTGVPVGIKWNQHLVIRSYHVLPKGGPKRDAAMRFVAAAFDSEAQVRMAQLAGGAPTLRRAQDMIPSSLAPFLPTAPGNWEQRVALSDRWWGANLDRVEKEWTARISG
jgi:putative spermidine/putrescine transport system substrate-binding protein